MVFRSALILVLCSTTCVGIAKAADTPEIMELKKAGINVNTRREGGHAVYIKTAVLLTEDIWKNFEAIDLRIFFLNDATVFNDEQMARLCKFKALEFIFLNGPHVTEQGVAALGNLPKLREFGVHHLSGKDVFRGAGLAALKDNPNFEAMEFGGACIDDKGMDAIGQLTSLKKLGLYHMEITAAGIPNLSKLTHLEKLALEPAFKPDYTGADLRHITGLKVLQELIIKKMVLSYDDGLSIIAGMKQLKKVSFLECGISESDITRLKSELPDVKIEFTPCKAEDIARWQKLLDGKKSK